MYIIITLVLILFILPIYSCFIISGRCSRKEEHFWDYLEESKQINE